MSRSSVEIIGIAFIIAWFVWAVLVAIDPRVTSFDSKVRTQLLRYYAPEKITDELAGTLTRFL